MSPRDPTNFLALTGIAHVHMIWRNYAEAQRWATRSLPLRPDFDPSLWMQASALAHLGRLDEARKVVARVHALSPGVTAARLRAAQPAMEPERMAPIWEGLAMAGLPAGD